MADAPSSSRQLAASDSARLTARITLLSVFTASMLTAVKLAGWWASGSVALLASTADSVLDLVAAIATFGAVRYAVAPPDEEHRFGHGKAEAYAGVFQATLVLVSALLIAREAVSRWLHPSHLSAQGWAIAVMAVSIAATLALIRAQTRVIAATGSVAVSGDRAHYAADLASNVAVVVGLLAARLLGDSRLDAAAGLFVAAWLAWGVMGVLRDASRHLMDRELGDADRQSILRLALDDPRVLGVHEFRTRAAGPFVYVQMHMDLEPEQTLHAAHEIVVAAERRIVSRFPSADVRIHPDPKGRAEPHGRFGDERVRAD